MATSIYNYDGTLLTTIPDGSIETTSASIKFPGRGYINYGEPVNENMLWIMQNFASASSPTSPLNGQLWYDTNTKLIKVYDSTSGSWVSVGGVIRSSTPPVTGSNVGALWYDTTKNQLHVWSGSAWLLLGPLGASDSLDPLNPASPAYSRIDAAVVSDGVSTHQIWRICVGTLVLAIFSKDASFVPNPAISGFSTINPGLNFNGSIANIGVSGDTTLFRNNQTNVPNANNTYDLGSTSFRFANVFGTAFNGTSFTGTTYNGTTYNGTTFNGTATQARYADLAERYASDKEYAPGTVVKLGGDNEITACTRPGDPDVLGVISTNPGYLMNSEAGNDSTHPPVALTGRIPCKVVGQVKKGQRLMSSSMEGVACAWDPIYEGFSIIGRALEDKTTHGAGTIEIVVGKN